MAHLERNEIPLLSVPSHEEKGIGTFLLKKNPYFKICFDYAIRVRVSFWIEKAFTGMCDPDH